MTIFVVAVASVCAVAVVAWFVLGRGHPEGAARHGPEACWRSGRPSPCSFPLDAGLRTVRRPSHSDQDSAPGITPPCFRVAWAVTTERYPKCSRFNRNAPRVSLGLEHGEAGDDVEKFLGDG